MSRRRNSYSNSNSFSKSIKDYIIPIIGFILIVVLFYSCFKKENVPVPSNENQVWIVIEKWNNASAKIYYLNWSTKTIDEVQKLFKWEKISVSSGNVKLFDEKADFNLSKLWELKYLENGNFLVSSWDIWVDTKSPLNLDMKFAKLKIFENSHISLSQNEVNSTIQVISWMVEVSNLKWRSTVLSSMESLTINNSQASDEKLTLKKEPVWDLFLKNDWFLLNKWNDYVNTWSTEEKNTWEISTWEISTWNISKKDSLWWKNKYITFSNLLDESNVSSSTIVVSWAYDAEEIWKIELNWKVAVLNPSTWTFKIDWVSVPEKENNLIFKVFDAEENLKEKFVYTVYNDAWIDSVITNSKNSSENNVFNVDWSNFTFTSPSASWSYTTTEWFVTIKWYVSAKNIDKVEVNWLKLKSFNWKTWRYHASEDYGNFVEWTNQYEVKYYSWTDLVYKNYFTIIKKQKGSYESPSEPNDSIAY